MKVCIVGGTGNISTSFIPLLLELGHEHERKWAAYVHALMDRGLTRG